MRGDCMDCPFPPASFDLITSSATLNHMPADSARTRMRELLKPGGALAIIGLARNGIIGLARSGIIGLPFELAPGYRHPAAHAPQGLLGHPSPIVWPPPLSYRQMRHIAAERLPGVQYRRHVLGRYSLRWTKPACSCCELTMGWVGVSARGLRRFPSGAAVRHRSGWRGPRPRRCGRW